MFKYIGKFLVFIAVMIVISCAAIWVKPYWDWSYFALGALIGQIMAPWIYAD